MRDTIMSSAFSTVSDITSGITGEKSYFSTDNVDIYMEMYEDFATALGQLYENVKKDFDGDGSALAAVSVVYENVLRDLAKNVFEAKFTTADFAKVVDTIVNSKDCYYKKTSDTAVDSQKTYYLVSEAIVTLWDTVSAGEYFEKSDDKYFLTEDTEFQRKTYYFFTAVENPSVSGLSSYYEYNETSIYAKLLENGFSKTTDTSVQSGKTYYTFAEAAVTAGQSIPAATYYVFAAEKYELTDDETFQSGKSYYVATEVVSPTGSNLGSYYECVDFEYNTKINEFVAAIEELSKNATALSSLAEDIISKYSSNETVVTMLQLGYGNFLTYLQNVVESYRSVLSDAIVSRYRTGSTVKTVQSLAATAGENAKQYMDNQWYSASVYQGFSESTETVSTTRRFKENGSNTWVTSLPADKTDSKGTEELTNVVEYTVTLRVKVDAIKVAPLSGSSSLNSIVRSGATGIKLTENKEYNQFEPTLLEANKDYGVGSAATPVATKITGVVYEKSGGSYVITSDTEYQYNHNSPSSSKKYYRYPLNSKTKAPDVVVAKLMQADEDYKIGDPINAAIYNLSGGKYVRTTDSAYKSGRSYYRLVNEYIKKLTAGTDYQIGADIGSNICVLESQKYNTASGTYQEDVVYYSVAPISQCLTGTSWIEATYQDSIRNSYTVTFNYDQANTETTTNNENTAWAQKESEIKDWRDGNRETLRNNTLSAYNSAIEGVYSYIDSVTNDMKNNHVGTLSSADDMLRFADIALSAINVWNVKKYEQAVFYKKVTTTVGDDLSGQSYYVYDPVGENYVENHDATAQAGREYYAYSFVPGLLYEKTVRDFGAYSRETFTLTNDTVEQSGKVYYKQVSYRPRYGDGDIGLNVLKDWKEFSEVDAGSFYKQRDQLYSLKKTAATIAEDYSSFYSSLSPVGRNAKEAAEAVYDVLDTELYGRTTAVNALKSRSMFYALYKEVYGSGSAWLDTVYGAYSLNEMFSKFTDALSTVIIEKYGEYAYQAVDRAIALPGMPAQFAACASEAQYNKFKSVKDASDVFDEIVYDVVYSEMSGEEIAILTQTFYNTVKDREFALNDFNVWRDNYEVKNRALLLEYMDDVFENLIQNYSTVQEVRATGTAFVNAYDSFTLGMANELIDLYVNSWNGTETFAGSDEEKLNSVVTAIGKLSRATYAEYASYVDFATYVNGLTVLNEAGKRSAWYSIVDAIESDALLDWANAFYARHGRGTW